MDNRSFAQFAPHLLEHYSNLSHVNMELVAMDFPGHSKSSHKSADGPVGRGSLSLRNWYTNRNGVLRMASLSSSSVHSFPLVGHSMGAAVACLYAVAFPEQIQSLVLLEGAGPSARRAQDVAKHVRQHM